MNFQLNVFNCEFYFLQHGEDEATLREYMKVIDELNVKAVCIESRPHPDYCGQTWWRDRNSITR